MANEKNLIAGAHKLTVDEQSKGGKKSGQARRKKKTLSELARMIADNPAPDNVKRKLVQLGIDEENADNNAAVAASGWSAGQAQPSLHPLPQAAEPLSTPESCL